MGSDGTLEFYRRKKMFGRSQWRWRVRASNGRILAQSSEGYNNQGDCVAAAGSTGYALTTGRAIIVRD